ncbi:hypothetical protein TNCV_2869661 [Trichonephila clavipes]|nr:hypothetical protein TNCV_2869661 [Trichonephila clavipes]
MCVHHDATKHGYSHLDAVNRTWINLKKRCLVICAPSFDVDHTFEDAPVWDAASRVAASMIFELRVHSAANIVELFV